MVATAGQLFEYYQTRERLPTYAGFDSLDQLSAYGAQRQRLFRDRLRLPTQVFKGARLAEFGPDSGENALVFARWGAALTLIEPNPAAWPRIDAYFERFELQQHLEARAQVELARYDSVRRFDIIDAEGFIYTIQPESVWLDVFRRILQPGGFFIISYYESMSALFELLHRAIYRFVLSGWPEAASACASRLFQTKWDSIPHTRSFASWTMDVLENPFVRLEYFFDAGKLCRRLDRAGFSLYSAWPPYQDGLAIRWHKSVDTDDNLDQTERFLSNSHLSHAFGRTLFLGALPRTTVDETEVALRLLITAVDALIDRADGRDLNECLEWVEQLDRTVLRTDLVVDGGDGQGQAHAALRSLAAIFSLMHRDDVAGLVDFCNSDAAFIRSWGMPAHYAVFRFGEASL
jgi:hypothetical protein